MIMAANHNPPAIFAPFTACPRKQETPAMLYFMRLRRLCRVFNISPYKRHTLVFLKRLNPVFSKRGHAPPFNKKKKKKLPLAEGELLTAMKTNYATYILHKNRKRSKA